RFAYRIEKLLVRAGCEERRAADRCRQLEIRQPAGLRLQPATVDALAAILAAGVGADIDPVGIGWAFSRHGVTHVKPCYGKHGRKQCKLPVESDHWNCSSRSCQSFMAVILWRAACAAWPTLDAAWPETFVSLKCHDNFPPPCITEIVSVSSYPPLASLTQG